MCPFSCMSETLEIFPWISKYRKTNKSKTLGVILNTQDPPLPQLWIPHPPPPPLILNSIFLLFSQLDALNNNRLINLQTSWFEFLRKTHFTTDVTQNNDLLALKITSKHCTTFYSVNYEIIRRRRFWLVTTQNSIGQSEEGSVQNYHSLHPIIITRFAATQSSAGTPNMLIPVRVNT